GIGSDMNILNHYGIRSLILGIGIKGAHTRQEHISIQDLCQSCEWLLSIIKSTSHLE
ncbi:TPA: peptidase M20, partial [bacterium]|nr:peptidase M20 [bacterium]